MRVYAKLKIRGSQNEFRHPLKRDWASGFLCVGPIGVTIGLALHAHMQVSLRRHWTRSYNSYTFVC